MEQPNSKQCVCTTSDLDLWSEPPVQNGIEYSQDVEHSTITSIDNSDVLEFLIPGAGEEYTDLSNSYIRIRFKIVKADGSDISAGVKVAPVNNILHSLFSQVDIILNDVLVSPSNNLYPYKAYLEDVLSHGVEAENSYLTAAMYFKETPGELDKTTNANKSFEKRQTLAASSAVMECEGRLHTELCQQLKPIINGVDIRIRLVRAPPAFCIIKATDDEENYKIKITHATYVTRRVKLTKDLQNYHMTQLNKAPAIYPIKRITMKAATVQKDGRDFRNETFYTGDIPNKMFFCFVLNEAFNGHYQKNPFLFDHFNLCYVAIYLDGQQIPGKPLMPDFTNGHYTRSFLKTIQATGTLNSSFGPNITYDDFKKGFAIFGYDLTPDLAQSETKTKRKGKLQIEIKYSSALENLLSIIAYSEFDNNIYINRDRQIVFDYTS